MSNYNNTLNMLFEKRDQTQCIPNELNRFTSMSLDFMLIILTATDKQFMIRVQMEIIQNLFLLTDIDIQRDRKPAFLKQCNPQCSAFNRLQERILNGRGEALINHPLREAAFCSLCLLTLVQTVKLSFRWLFIKNIFQSLKL